MAGGTAAFPLLAAGLLVLLLLFVEGGNSGHRLAGLAALLIRWLRRGHCQNLCLSSSQSGMNKNADARTSPVSE